MTPNPAASEKIPEGSVSVPDGSVFVGGETLPGLLRQMPMPMTFCRMIYRDGRPYDFHYLFANPAFEEGLGLGPVIGKFASEVIPGFWQSTRPILGIYGRVAAGGGPEGYDLYLEPYRKWATVEAFSPRPDHFVAVYRVLETKVIGRRLRGIFESMAEGFVVQDPDGRIIDSNPAAERILELTGEQMRGRTSTDPRWQAVDEGLAPYPGDRHPAMVTLRTGEALRERIMGLRFPDGRLKWISINTEPIGGDGAPDYVVSTFADVTARRETERQRLATLETMGDGFVALDAQWRFAYVNAAAERMLGARRDALIGRDQWELYPATLGSPVEEAYREAASGRPMAFENFYEPWKRWFSCRCFPREGGGITVFFTDVTETREAQESLRRSHEDLRSLVGQMNAAEGRERSRIARELHDELQQSLAAVRLEIKAIRRRIGNLAPGVEELADTAARNLDLVIESTRRIIGDLRPTALDTLGLGAAIETAAERFKALTGLRADVRILGNPSVEAGLPDEVGYCLYRIAQESLNNVHKHADAGQVELHLDLRTPGQVELLVRDDGRGIQPHELRKEGSFGVLGIRERLHALGGELTLCGWPAGGTVVRAIVPLPVD